MTTAELRFGICAFPISCVLKVCAMHAHCPYCQGQVVQTRNHDGPNFCPECRKLFYVPEEPHVPSWILGVLVVLVANWQVLLNH